MQYPLRRTTSYPISTNKITPSTCLARSTSLAPDPKHKPLVPKPSFTSTCYLIRPGFNFGFSSLLRSLLNLGRWLAVPGRLPLSRTITGTLFGRRHGYVSFAVQVDLQSEPVLLVELALSTSALVREMSSGLVRIALECAKPPLAPARGSLASMYEEPVWTMYLNGRRYGQVATRQCCKSDWHVLDMVGSVSVGAGVIPVLDGGKVESATQGELLFMRARFERVVGGRDSEAFYMLNPDGNGGPELSIFLLRI